ncbi:hypothetical protein OESDEN_12576 [Oesophagostomum dentatum]|uniref:Uncharacterized protein n=1 Tax=Oesophagostomum dentatum TaxID=61180 RepID=A0A0B1SRV2_OESDE|nr:hypothetical protein OESDEN_12576 [Oesophagostomum dentatum]
MLLTLELITLLICCFVDVTALIRCKKCEYDLESEHEVCEQDCLGTLCFYSEYYYTQPERLFARKASFS